VNKLLTVRTGTLLAAGAIALAGCARPQVSALRYTPGNAEAIRQALGAGKSAAATAAAEAPKPTGWATIRGKFVMVGTPPPRPPLSVTKDHNICAPGGRAPLSEEVVVDANGGIKDVVIYLTSKIPLDDPAWIHPAFDAAKEAELVFDQKQCVFLTHLFAARTTNKIRLQNSDPVGHNTNIQGKGSASINVNLAANDFAMYLPGRQSPEPFDVSCSVHPWMAAKMIIRDSPYFAVTRPDGSFEIAAKAADGQVETQVVPAGVELEFRIWQEKSKFIQAGKLNGQEVKWPRGRFKIKLEPGQVLEMNVEVPASAFGG
jgi:hypothetical protein